MTSSSLVVSLCVVIVMNGSLDLRRFSRWHLVAENGANVKSKSHDTV